MTMQTITKVIMDNLPTIISAFVVLFFVMLIVILNLSWELSRMKKRYKKMMTGVESDNLERMLLGHIDEVRQVAEENHRLDEETKRIDQLLNLAITRVSVLRFCAFEDMGSDLSYSVALLDSHNNGVVMSSIFGREDSRSYVKPIENGQSTYALTKEEEKVLKEAMGKRP